ncbi:CoF synthetase [Arenibacter aquaticus]|uniref:CoF synthetase n=1 Tax=Arenibacter aquaticus TaxID=2489054 RepID=A0A3S0BXE3_9FLAO|nr:CoF synthetase [Arenibacter aquaticus]RTE53816.1 CoF synthetase [Arenibacter aquaticus]
MGILFWLRNSFFWTMDALKGSSVKKDFLQIETCFKLSSFEELQQHNKPILKHLLNTAVSESTFYKKYAGYKSLRDFPVVDKHIIKKNFDEISISDKTKEKLFTVSTSGSTGTPFKIFQSKRKKTRNTADTLYFANSAGYFLGHQLLYLRLWSAYYRKSNFLAKLQNIRQLDVQDLDEPYIEKLIEELKKDKSIKGWLGYPSGFEKICNYLDKTGSGQLDCNIQSIIAMSEGLSHYVKSKMEYYFQAPVVSRYSNVENGIIAQQKPGEKYFTINWASYHVEILDINKDIPVKTGEIGRIVVTDLYNTATPMIRYDTGDLGSFSFLKDQHNKFPMLSSVQGRKMDVLLDTNGNLVSPFKMYNYLHDYPELDQVQFIQSGKNRYTIKINKKGSFKRENEFVYLFKKDMGKDAVISIEYVDEIPLLKSGKRKLTVNLCQ